jgi:DNA-directed RNA polymerase specialized sigma24 family protein
VDFNLQSIWHQLSDVDGAAVQIDCPLNHSKPHAHFSENLGALSPPLGTAFLLREVEGYSTGEATKKLGVTESTVKARLWRARHQMAERLRRRLRRIKDDVTGRSRDTAAMMSEQACTYC